VYNKVWEEQYLFADVGCITLCLLCGDSLSVQGFQS